MLSRHLLAFGRLLADRRKLRVVVGLASDAPHEDLQELRAAKREEHAGGRALARHRDRNRAVMTHLGNLLRGVVELQVQRLLKVQRKGWRELQVSVWCTVWVFGAQCANAPESKWRAAAHEAA